MNKLFNKFSTKLSAYNEKAEKWGYEKVVYDTSTKSVVGTFKSKCDEVSGFWHKVVYAYRDGYMKEDFNKLIKLSNSLSNDVFCYFVSCVDDSDCSSH